MALLLAATASRAAGGAAEYWARAQAALKNANYPEAESLYRKFLSLSPSTAEAYVNLGLALHQQKKAREAIDSFRTALKLNPKLAHARLFLGMNLFNLNDTAGALDSLKQYTSAAPQDPQGFYYLGLSHAARGETEHAAEALEHAARLAPKDVDILYHLAQSYITQANAIARRAAGHDPKLPLLHEWEKKQKAGIEDLMRQRPQASTGKEILTALKPRLNRTPPDLEAEQRAALAYAGLYLDTTRRFVEIDPNSFRVRQLLAAYYEKSGQVAKAIDELKRVIEQHPNVRGLHFSLGSIYKDQSDPEHAAEQFREELKLSSPEPDTRLQLAQVYLMLNEPQKALTELESAKQTVGEQNATLWKTFGKAYTAIGDHAKAAASYEKAMAMGEADRALYYQLGQAYRRLGKMEQARKMFAASNEAARLEQDRLRVRTQRAIEAQAKERAAQQ